MKKILCLTLVLCLLCAPLTGCEIEVETEEERQETEESGYQLFYLAASEDGLVRESYVPEEDTSEFMLADLMQRLGRKEGTRKGVSLLPAEVSINSYDRQDSLLIIDFNRAYSSMSSIREILARSGVALTFLQIPGIRSVRFTVEGSPLLNSRKEEIGDMDRDTFVEFSGGDPADYRYGTFTLYFTDRNGEKLVEETRNVYYKRSLPRERVVLEQLAKGPMEKGNYPTIPGNSSVRSVMLSDRVCYVDMSRSFLDYALDVPPEIMVYSVVNTLLAASEADRVQISVQRETEGDFGEGLPLYAFYERNEELVDSGEEPASGE